jgi:putative transcriptional regulator
VSAKREFKSDAFEAIHSAVEDMLAAGTIDNETMKGFEKACLPATAEPSLFLVRGKARKTQ